MPYQRHLSDAVHWYMSELSGRIVAESGQPSDRHHLGKLILMGLRDAPDFILQIDGGTGKSETNASVLARSVRCAVALRSSGLAPGDVVLTMAPNHLDLAIVNYASLYLGLAFAAIDKNTPVDQLKKFFESDNPKFVFCQADRVPDVNEALDSLMMEARVVSFDELKDNVKNHCNFAEFMEKGVDEDSVQNFSPANFDPDATIANLILTSGTTGVPKQAILTHKNFAVNGLHLWSKFNSFPTPSRMILLPAPLLWLSSVVHYIFSPIMRYTRLQSSEPSTPQHVHHLINTYKPTVLVTSASMMRNITAPEDIGGCDFSSFEMVVFGGSAVAVQLIELVRQLIPKAAVNESYGFTEASTYFVFEVGCSPDGSCGRPIGHLQYRLIDVETQEDISEPNRPGDLWVKGPGVSRGYYNNAEATKEAITEDGWYKTGDIMYRDEHWNFYFVDRIKSLIRYRTYLISPTEIEDVLRGHPGVFDAAVTELPHPECMGVPAACVVRKPGSDVTAHELKLLVRDTLEDWKHLRGGIVFLQELPTTPSTKLDRRKLKEIVIKENRE